MNRRIITFSFLATINNGNHIYDNIAKVYEPVVKYVISNIYSRNQFDIILTDFISEFLLSTGIDLPIPLIDEILNILSTNGVIHYTKDSTIQIMKYSFENYLESYEDNISDLKYIEEDFSSYIKENNFDDELNFYDFVDLYCSKLISFTNEISCEMEVDEKYYYHYKYLRSISNDRKKKEIVKKIFWGMLVTFYVSEDSFDITAFKNNKILVDTSFFISLMGYHNEISNTISLQVYQLATNLGIRFYTFDQTIEEIKNLLNETALKIKKSAKPSEIFDNDITLATYKNPNVSPTDLEFSAKNINSTIKKFNISVEYIERFKNKVLASELYKYFIETIHKDKLSAFHDTAAIEYVKSCRRNRTKHIEDAKCWFIQDRKNSSNSIFNKEGYINEKISSHDMLLLLWLSSPTGLNIDKLAEIEFAKLIMAVNERFTPDRALLKEFEENLEKYSFNELKDQEIATIYLISSTKTVQDIANLNGRTESEFNCEIRNWITQFEKEQEYLKISNDFAINEIVNVNEFLYHLIMNLFTSSDHESVYHFGEFDYEIVYH